MTTWLDGDTVIKEERCDDEGEILSLVTDGHLTELRWEHIPPQTRVICQGAAMSCDAIREIRLEHLESVEQGAFQRCDNLERVVIGPDVEEIAEGAFPQCSGLWDVDVSENTNPALAAVNAQYLRGQADEIPPRRRVGVSAAGGRKRQALGQPPGGTRSADHSGDGGGSSGDRDRRRSVPKQAV